MKKIAEFTQFNVLRINILFWFFFQLLKQEPSTTPNSYRVILIQTV